MKKFFGKSKKEAKSSQLVDEKKRRMSFEFGNGKWWKHLPAIDNPLLFEPLLHSGGIVDAKSDSEIEELLATYCNSDDEDLDILDELLRVMPPDNPAAYDVEGLTLLHTAAKRGFAESLKIMLAHDGGRLSAAAKNMACSRFGNTPLHLAAKYGHSDCVHILLNAKADPLHSNFNGKTALHFACSHGYSRCVEALLQQEKWNRRETNGKKRLIDMQDEYGHTSLHLAVIDGNIETVKTLLNYFPNISIRDDEHRTPRDVASLMDSADHTEIVRLLDLKPAKNGAPDESEEALFKGLALHDNCMDTANERSSGLFSGLSVHEPAAPLNNGFSINAPEKEAKLNSEVPPNRWVVLQSGKLVADRATGFILVHESRHSAALWAHKWKWSQVNATEDAKWAKKRSSLFGLHLPRFHSDAPDDERNAPASKTKNKLVKRNSATEAPERRSSFGSLSSMLPSCSSEEQSLGAAGGSSHLCIVDDDGSDLFVAEICPNKWERFAATHDFKLMEVHGQDPLLDSYLAEQCGTSPREMPDLSLSSSELQVKTSTEEQRITQEIALLRDEIASLRLHVDAEKVENKITANCDKAESSLEIPNDANGVADSEHNSESHVRDDAPRQTEQEESPQGADQTV